MGKYDQYKEGRSGGYGKASYRSLCESEQGSELTTTKKKGFRGDCSVFKLLTMQV